MITRFDGSNRWLSNFWPAEVRWGGTFPSVEHAYQAAKCLNKADMARFKTCTAGQAKRIGRSSTLRPDWEQIKLRVMEHLLRQKFAHGSDLAHLLLATGTEELVEGNTWGDRY